MLWFWTPPDEPYNEDNSCRQSGQGLTKAKNLIQFHSCHWLSPNFLYALEETQSFHKNLALYKADKFRIGFIATVPNMTTLSILWRKCPYRDRDANVQHYNLRGMPGFWFVFVYLIVWYPSILLISFRVTAFLHCQWTYMLLAKFSWNIPILAPEGLIVIFHFKLSVYGIKCVFVFMNRWVCHSWWLWTINATLWQCRSTVWAGVCAAHYALGDTYLTAALPLYQLPN